MELFLQYFAAAPDKKTIYDFVISDEIVAYWESPAGGSEDYLGEGLWPEQQKMGLKLEWVKGAGGLPVVLKPSAFDVVAQKRGYIGFDTLTTYMPFFKEGHDINEELRQLLNQMLETGNQSYIDNILNNIFNGTMDLLKGAAAQRERMRMMALTTGYITIAANGQAYDYDYALPEDHKVEAVKAWSDPTADIMEDIRDWMDTIEADTGERPERAVCSRKTFSYLRKNKEIRSAIVGSDATPAVKDQAILDYLYDDFGLDLEVYAKKYRDEANQVKPYVPDDTFVMFPSGPLGTGWFGTTPEQSDLMSGNAANVSITDTGVAVTTSKKVDPVNVVTKVSMIYLPSFEQADKVLIASVGGA